ncbi:MAG: hypothetical protein JSW45_02750 [Thiotrichales bacterium]|nr:MAG: hypothetical protein JSW45_02750 [Thiotrichales bacterium]
MKKIVKYLPGLTGAVCGYALLRLMSWTGLTYEFAAFVITYLVVTVLMDSALRGYGKKS